jgi:hypothetical protein
MTSSDDKALTVAAMCVCNPDRSPVGINRGDAAPTPTGFAEIVSDDFPVIHAAGLYLFAPGLSVILRCLQYFLRNLLAFGTAIAHSYFQHHKIANARCIGRIKLKFNKTKVLSTARPAHLYSCRSDAEPHSTDPGNKR